MGDADAITISRVVDLDGTGRSRSAFIIARVRALVREARLARPELAGYDLQEIGLQTRAGRIRLNLYFHRSTRSAGTSQ